MIRVSEARRLFLSHLLGNFLRLTFGLGWERYRGGSPSIFNLAVCLEGRIVEVYVLRRGNAKNAAEKCDLRYLGSLYRLDCPEVGSLPFLSSGSALF